MCWYYPLQLSSNSTRSHDENSKLIHSNCHERDECKDWTDKAAALASYAKQANDEELISKRRGFAIAIRRAGELLKQIEPNKGGRPPETREGDHPSFSRKDPAADAGFSSHQAKQAVRVANVPIEDFEQQVESDKPPTLRSRAKNPRGRDPNESTMRCAARIELAAVKPAGEGGSPAGFGTRERLWDHRKDNAIKPERFLAQPRAKRANRGFSWIGDSTRQAHARSCEDQLAEQ